MSNQLLTTRQLAEVLNVTEATALAPRLENITWYKVEIEDGLFGLDIFLHCTGEQGLGGKPA